MKKLLGVFCLFILLACGDDFMEPVTLPDYLYSGSIRIMQNPQIVVDGKAYENGLGSGPIQVTVAEHKETDQIQFTIYGKRYSIYDADFWINHPDCMEYNNLEQTIIERDANGNDVVKIFYPDSFWKDCYYEGKEEKSLVFLIKSKQPFY